MKFFSISHNDREFLVEWEEHKVIVYILTDNVSLEPFTDLYDAIRETNAYLEISNNNISPIVTEDSAREYATTVIDELELAIKEGKIMGDCDATESDIY